MLGQRCLVGSPLLSRRLPFVFSSEKEHNNDKKDRKAEVSLSDVWQTISRRS
jgi:hypothetical protein